MVVYQSKSASFSQKWYLINHLKLLSGILHTENSAKQNLNSVLNLMLHYYRWLLDNPNLYNMRKCLFSSFLPQDSDKADLDCSLIDPLPPPYIIITNTSKLHHPTSAVLLKSCPVLSKLSDLNQPFIVCLIVEWLHVPPLFRKIKWILSRILRLLKSN